MNTKKIQVSRNVKFDESTRWNWEKNEVEANSDLIVRNEDPHKQIDIEADPESEEETEITVKGTRPLSDIYEKCNVALLEPANYIEAAIFDH